MKSGIKIIDWVRNTKVIDRYEFLKKEDSLNLTGLYPDKQRLAFLLLNLKQSNPFYGRYLQNYSVNDIKCDPVSILNRLPVIDKKTVNEHYSSFYKPIRGRKLQRKKTGGSTGSPFYYYVENEHLSWFWAYIYFFWNKYSSYNPGDPFITVAGTSLSTGRKKVIEKTYHYLQNNYFIKGDIINPQIQINTKRVSEAVLLYGYPSSIINLIKVRPDFTGMVKNVKAIFTTSEQLLPQTRKNIEKAFNLPVYDMYGANDGGILTCECPKHNGYHLNIHNCYVETFVNEHGMSELLLTNLNTFGFPLVRYRVGDIGRLDTGECSCGLSTPRISELKGRTRDVLKLKDGSTVHGSLFNKVFFNHEIIDGYKILQNKDLSITLSIHLKDDNQYEVISSQLKKEFSSILGKIDLSITLMPESNPTNDKFKLIESHAV